MNQPVYIIDGGVGTELQRRGAEMHPCCWSSRAHLDNPGRLFEIHRDYIQAGATVISTNTFMACRHLLEGSGIWNIDEVNRSAVELAKKSRNKFANSEILIAGSMSTLPPLNQANDLPRGDRVVMNFREQALLLAEAGVDVLLAEMLLDSESASSLLEACCETGLPVWAGLSVMRNKNSNELMAFRPVDKLRDLTAETFDSLLTTVCSLPVTAVGVMHTHINFLASALSAVAARWKGSRLAYAQTGSAGEYDWNFEDAISPDKYAEQAKSWVENYEVTVIGGCCGTRPEHVRALSEHILGT